MPEAFLFEDLSSKVYTCYPKCGLHCEICLQLNINENSRKKNLPSPHHDSDVSKPPSVYLIMLTEEYFCQFK